MKSILFGLAAIGMALTGAPSQAAYVVNTGDSGTSTFDWTLDPAQSLAGYFTLGTATTIGSVEGYFDSANGASVTISIVSDGAKPSDGSVLFSDSLLLNGTQGFQGLFGKSWALAAGSYWVTFESPDGTGMWDTAPSPLAAYSFTNSGTWYDASSYLNLGIRIADSTGAVPEPATWAMMIGGFALAGAAMRRRTVVVSFA